MVFITRQVQPITIVPLILPLGLALLVKQKQLATEHQKDKLKK
jgi:hypothetical protein